MRWTSLIALCAALIAFRADAADDARRAMSEGLREYEGTAFDKASAAFDKAAQAAPDQKLDAAVARYNEANALFRDGKFQDAASRYSDALRSPDLALQSKAYFNRGNALFNMAAAEEAQGQMDIAGKALDEAISMYERAMTLAPRDEDPKVNYELALKRKLELEQKQQQQQDQQKDKDQEKQDQNQPSDNQDQQQQKQQQQEEQKQEQGQSQAEKDKDDQTAQEQPAQPTAPSEAMTPEEAKLMLDAMKQDEQSRREQLKMILGQPTPVEKDW